MTSTLKVSKGLAKGSESQEPAHFIPLHVPLIFCQEFLESAEILLNHPQRQIVCVAPPPPPRYVCTSPGLCLDSVTKDLRYYNIASSKANNDSNLTLSICPAKIKPHPPHQKAREMVVILGSLVCSRNPPGWICRDDKTSIHQDVTISRVLGDLPMFQSQRRPTSTLHLGLLVLSV